MKKTFLQISNMKSDKSFLILLLSNCLIIIGATASFMTGISQDNISFRIEYHLSTYIIPVHYDMLLTLHTGNKYANTFSGKTEIELNIHILTQNVSLHVSQSYVHIFECILWEKNNLKKIYKPVIYIYYNTTNLLVLNFKTELSPNIYILRMKFKGAYDKKDLMFHHIQEKRHEIRSDKTYFQSIHSRMFPCLDEPAIRTTFSIHVKHHSTLTVLSTMPIKDTIPRRNSMKMTGFLTTKALPAYLVGIVFADLELLNNDTASTILNQWYGKRYSADNIKFARMIAENVSVHAEIKWKNYRTTNKVDHLVIPDLKDNSVQYLGFATYKETDIIYNEKLTPAAQKIKVARILSYTMAHQWFGDFITPAWWSDMWLIDGISILFGINTIDKILPNSRMFDLFVAQYRHESLHLDAYFMEPLISELNIPSKINSLAAFSRYIKAPVILHMLECVVSNRVFWKGFRTYIDEYRVKPIIPNHLWKSIQNALKEISEDQGKSVFNIESMMDAWTKQTHYPILNAKLEKDNFCLTISLQNASHKRNWWIPVTFATKSRSNFEGSFNFYGKWLKNVPSASPSCEFFLNGKEKGWIIVNLKQAGYYRVNYAYNNWLRIGNSLHFEDGNTKIHPLNRAQLIDDSFHFMITGQLDASIFWIMATYLKRDTDYIAWYPMFKILEYMSSVLPLQKPRIFEIKNHLSIMLDELLKKIGYDERLDEHDFIKCLKQEAAKWACIVGISECKMSAKHKLEQHLKDPATHKLLPWWKDWTYCKGMMAKAEDDLNSEEMFQMLQNNRRSDNRLFESMACYGNPKVISIFLERIINESDIFTNLQNITRINSYLLTVSRNARNEQIFKEIMTRFETIKPKEVSTVVALINIINHVHSKSQLNQILKFVKNNEKQLITHIEQKIKIRWSEIKYQISYLMQF